MSNGRLIQHIMRHTPQPDVPMAVSNTISVLSSSNYVTRLRQEAANFANVYIETDASTLLANKNCQHMFAYLPNLLSVNMSGFSFNNTTNMSEMFAQDSKLQTIHGIESWNTEKVTDFSGMFMYCNNFNGDLSSWNMDNAKYLDGMFMYCTNFSGDLSNWNISNVKSMGSMFASGHFPSSLFGINVSNCNMYSMFMNTDVSDISVSNWNLTNCDCGEIFGNINSFNLSNSTFLNNTRFYRSNANSLLKISDCNFVNSGFEYNANSISLQNVSFDNSTFNVGISVFITSYELNNVTILNSNVSLPNYNIPYRMFALMRNLHSINIYNLTIDKADMSYMFYRCNNLNRIDTSTWNISNIHNMIYMFDNCTNLTDINLYGLNVTNCNSLNYMFSSCSNLQSLDFSGWNTYNVTDMYMMFLSCNNLHKIWIPYNFIAATNAETINSPFVGYGFYNTCDVFLEGSSEHHGFVNSIGSPDANWHFHYSSTYQQFLNA